MRKSAGAVDRFEGLVELVGRGWAAVMVCGPTWISMVRQRRAVRTNFRMDYPAAWPGRGAAARPSRTAPSSAARAGWTAALINPET